MLKIVPKNAIRNDLKTVCLGISLHSSNHQGEALEGLIDWACGHSNNLIIDVSDTLHRHNYIADGHMPKSAWMRARKDGDDWLEENKDLIFSFPVSVKIIRWDHWLDHPSYQEIHQQFVRAFEEQQLFRDAVLADAMNFYKRKSVQLSEHALDCSVSYLLEEISAHSILYSENPCAVLYPGKQHSCYRLVREGKVSNVSLGIRRSVFTRLLIYNFDEQKKIKRASIQTAA